MLCSRPSLFDSSLGRCGFMDRSLDNGIDNAFDSLFGDFPSTEITKEGAVVTMRLPGLTAKDVTVEFDGDTLAVHAAPRYSGTFDLPATFDAASVTASLLNGLLKICLPRKQDKESTNEPVAIEVSPDVEMEADKVEEEADKEAEGMYTYEIAVPGVAASELAVTVKPSSKRSTNRNVLAVASDAHPSLRKTVTLPADADVGAGAITATCQHGLLRLRVPRRQAAAITVSAASSSPDDDQDNQAVLSINLPGLAAEDVSLALLPDGSLRLSRSDTQGVAWRLPASLPRHAREAGKLNATLLNGVLKLLAPKKPEPTKLAVDSDTEAAFPTKENNNEKEHS